MAADFNLTLMSSVMKEEFSSYDIIMKDIKHQFMAYRNGIVADFLRKSGMEYNIIFGLQLPQLAGIARRYGQDITLAEKLWDDRTVRESRLLACYLFPKDKIDFERARALAFSVQTQEEADILCFRLLRYLPFSQSLADILISSPEQFPKYCGVALQRNLDAMA